MYRRLFMWLRHSCIEGGYHGSINSAQFMSTEMAFESSRVEFDRADPFVRLELKNFDRAEGSARLEFSSMFDWRAESACQKKLRRLIYIKNPIKAIRKPYSMRPVFLRQHQVHTMRLGDSIHLYCRAEPEIVVTLAWGDGRNDDGVCSKAMYYRF